MSDVSTTIRALARRTFLSRVIYCNSESEAALHINDSRKDGRITLPALSCVPLGDRLRLSWSKHGWRSRAFLSRARLFLSTLQKDWIRLRSSSEVPARVFPSATPPLSDERNRLRILGENLEAELPRQSNAGRCLQNVASVWRCRFAADSSRLASEAAGKMVGIELRRAGCRWRVTNPALSIASGVLISTMATFSKAPL